MPDENDLAILSLSDAKDALRHGIRFGDVYPYLTEPANGELLKAYFAFGKHLESNPAAEARMKGYTGDECSQCKGMRMVRTGVCLRCEDCGSTSGGCS